MSDILKTIHAQHTQAIDGLFHDCSETLTKLAARCVAAFAQNHKLFFCGNGGSACDAAHIAGEFVGRFVHDRRALPAIALTADAGILTAVANDYSYEEVFSRQIEALGAAGDVLVAMSTSGQSANVLKALHAARNKGMTTVLFTGEKGRNATSNIDFSIIVPSLITAHVQEAHMVALHALASLIEAQLFAGA